MRRAARRRPERERGLSATSPGVGLTARRVSSSASGVRPQPHTGMSGGQMQPRARSARKRLTRRSSSEWKEIAASRPSVAQDGPGGGQRAVERLQLLVHRDANGLEDALGRVAASEAPADRGRQRGLDGIDQLAGGLERSPHAAPHDLAGDDARVRILAVAAKDLSEAALVPARSRPRARRAPARDPSACRAARRRSRRSRARGRPPASRRCRGPGRRGRPRSPPRAAARAPRSTPCA